MIITIQKPDLKGYIVLPKRLSGGKHHYCTKCNQHFVVAHIKKLARNANTWFDYCPFCGARE